MAAPQLIFTDTANYNKLINQHSLYLDEMNMVLGDYNALGLPALTGIGEFISLMNSPVDLVFDKMTGGQPVSLSKVQVNRADAIKILAKPVGYDTLIEMIDAFKKHHPQWNGILGDKDIVGGAVVVSQATKDAQLKACQIFIVTADEQKKYDFAQDVIAAAINRFGSSKINIEALVSGIIKTTPTDGATPAAYAVVPQGIKGDLVAVK